MDENKKKAEALAGKENKDVQSVTYDKNQNKLLDFDDLMQEDNEVVKRLKNLFKFGVTEEQIRNIYNMSLDITIGGSKEEAFENLEKVFLALAIKITNYPNGIVIDLKTGEIDEALSKIQCRELNIPYEKIEGVPETTKIAEMVEIVSAIKINNVKEINLEEYYNWTKDAFDAIGDYYSTDDISIRRNMEFGVTEKEGSEINDIIEYGTIKAIADRDFMYNLFKYQEMVKEGAPQEEIERIQEKIKQNTESKYYKEFEKKYGSIDFEHLPEFLDDWNKKHSAALLHLNIDKTVEMFQKNNITFDKIADVAQKEKIVKVLARGFVSDIKATHKYFVQACRALGINPDFEGIKKIAESVGIEINSVEDIKTKFEKVIDIDNFEEEFSKIVLGSEYENEKESMGKTALINDKRKELVYNTLNKRFNDRAESNEIDENPLILMDLFRKYYKEKDHKNLKIISNYIKDIRPYLEEYLGNLGLEEKNIFNKNGDVGITKVESILENIELSKNAKNTIEEIENEISMINNSLENIRKSEQPRITKIRENVEKLKENRFDSKSEEEILAQLSSLPIGALSSGLVQELRGLELYKVNEKLQEKLGSSKTISASNVFKVNRDNASYKVKSIYNLLNDNLDVNYLTGEDTRAIDVITLYQHYYNGTQSTTTVSDIIADYIKDNSEYFENYFKNKGLEVDTVFNRDGSISINRISAILDELGIDEENPSKRMQNFERAIDNRAEQFEQIRNKNEDKLQELNRELTFFKNESSILKLLEQINPRALDDSEIKKLRELKLPKVEEKLTSLLSKDKVLESSFSRNIRNDEEKKKIEKILLIEAKLEMSKGTTRYSKTLEERTEFYKNNPDLIEKAGKMRGKRGILKDGWKTRIGEYIDKLVDETVRYGIKTNDPLKLNREEKKRYATLLLVGMNSKDTLVKEQSVQSLKILYSNNFNFDNAIREEDVAKIVYTLEYGEELDANKLKEKIQAMRKNLSTRLVKNRKIDKDKTTLEEELSSLESLKLSDSEFPFEELAEELIASGDLTKTEMQNYFNSSQVKFSERNVETFKKLNMKTTIDSWIEDKEDAVKYHYVLIMSELDRVQNGDEKDERKIRKLNSELNRFLKNNPTMAKKMQGLSASELGNIKEQGEKFAQDKIDAEILRTFSKSASVPYSKLTPTEKRHYLEVILIARERAKTTNDPEIKEIFTKFSNRNLEVLNSEEVTYIEFDGDGNAIVNEENVMKEVKKQYNFVKNIEVTDLDELQDFVLKKAKAIFVRQKMRVYSSRDKDEFQKLKSKTPEEKLREIEQIRLEKAQEKEFIATENHEFLKREAQKMKEKNMINSENASIELTNPPETGKAGKLKEEITGLEDMNNAEEKMDYMKERKTGLLDRIKNFFSRIVTPKLPKAIEETVVEAGDINTNNSIQIEEIQTEGYSDQIKNKGIVLKIVNGIKDAFSNKENYKGNISLDTDMSVKLKATDESIIQDNPWRYSQFDGNAQKLIASRAIRNSSDLGKEVTGNPIPVGSNYGEEGIRE